jgi:hypothetical protein
MVENIELFIFFKFGAKTFAEEDHLTILQPFCKMFALKPIPDETITVDIHFQDDLTPSNIATLSIELVNNLFLLLFIFLMSTYL